MGVCWSCQEKSHSNNRSVAYRHQAHPNDVVSFHPINRADANVMPSFTSVSAATPVVSFIPQNGRPIMTATPLPSIRVDLKVVVRALYSYEAQNKDDLNFQKEDRMEILGDMSEPWWYARHRGTLEEGYIPSNYVLVDDGKPTSLDSWFEISRRDADKYLLLMGNPRGTYIIRPSSEHRNYALSIREWDANRDMWLVKHYKIRPLDNCGYFISPRITFNTIQDLILHYQNRLDGLCCRLSIACPRQYKPPVEFREIEVNRSCIHFLRKLGSGSFGEVWLGKWNNTMDVAVKMLRPGSMDGKKFIQEAQLMHKLNHPRIVRILGVCTKEEPCYILTELMVNGALLDHLRKDEGRCLKENHLLDMMGQICEGMAYLEELNFVHRDLRAANILVGESNFVKVADFGLARVTQNDNDVYHADEGTKFPIKWTAPEAALNRMFSVKSDVWSFGVLMYEIVTYGRQPYPGMSNRQVLEEVQRGYRMPNPHGGHIHCSLDLYQLMLACWDKRVDDRPTFIYLKDVFENFVTATESQYLGPDLDSVAGCRAQT